MNQAAADYYCLSQDYARIFITRHTGPLESVAHTYQWHGPVTAPALLSLPAGDISSLPWPLVLIEDRPWIGGGLYVRTDVRWWRVTAARYALRRAWEWFTMRAVLTLHVWGLAHYEHGKIPSWRDVGRRR